MSRKSEGMEADLLDNRWSYTDVRTNATFTAQLAPSPQSAKDRVHLDFFNLVFMSKNATNMTVSAQVRDASVAGTVLAQWPLLLGVSSTAQVSPANIHLIAERGKSFFITTDTVIPSVTASVNAAGWTCTSLDY